MFLINQNGFEGAQRSLDHPDFDPSIDHNHAIRWCAQRGYTKLVARLLKDPRVDPSDCENDALYWSVVGNHPKVVKVLLGDPRVDPTFYDNNPLRLSARRGLSKIVDLLLADPRVDPSASDNYALCISTAYGYTEIVRLLLKHPRFRHGTSRMLVENAARKYNFDIVELLLNDPRFLRTQHISDNIPTHFVAYMPRIRKKRPQDPQILLRRTLALEIRDFGARPPHAHGKTALDRRGGNRFME